MTSYAAPYQSSGTETSATREYSQAHWYFLAAFIAVIAGFWNSFFHPMGSGTWLKNLHGVTASLWYVVLIAQSWLMARGLVRWHRRVAITAIVLLPVLSASALGNTSRMLTDSLIPAPFRPVIAFIDFQLVAQLCVLVTLGVLNRGTPSAHKRFMAATALIGLPPALARLFDQLGIRSLGPIHTPLLVCNLILLILIVVDWRKGESRRRAYPLLLGWNLALQLLIGPLSATQSWLAFCRWFAAKPL